MLRKITVVVNDGLLARAKVALEETTTRSTIEKALRLAAESAPDRSKWPELQLRYLAEMPRRVDLAVLDSGEMWR